MYEISIGVITPTLQEEEESEHPFENVAMSSGNSESAALVGFGEKKVPTGFFSKNNARAPGLFVRLRKSRRAFLT